MMKTLGRIVATLVLLVLPIGSASAKPEFLKPGAEEGIEEMVLCDFSQPDWQRFFTNVSPHVTLSEDPRFASRGEVSMKVVASRERGIHRHWMFHVELGRMGGSDWRGWDALEFDVHNPGSQDITMVMWSHTAGGRNIRKCGLSAPPGWSRYAVSTRGPWYMADADEVDRSRMGRLWISVVERQEPEREAVLYLDNFRLVDRVTGLLRELNGEIEGMIEALRQMAEYPGKANDSERVRELERSASTLLRQARQDRDPEVREDLRRAALDLDRRVRLMSETVSGRGLESLAGMMPRKSDWDRFGARTIAAGPGVGKQDRLEALQTLEERLRNRIARARLEAEIGRHFPDADFAIGMPEYPTAWTARPQDYRGPLGREVFLQAARREHEPFQFLLLPGKKPMTDVRIAASDLQGPGIIEAENVEIAPMGWQWFPEGEHWLSTMLRPDIEVFDVEAGMQQPVWVNLYVPEGTPPGEYRGMLRITADDMDSEQIAVNLEVWDFALPRHPSMLSAGGASMNDEYAQFVISRRWNPHRLYGTLYKQDHYER